MLRVPHSGFRGRKWKNSAISALTNARMGPNRGTLVGVPRERIGRGKGRVCFFTLVDGPERRENLV